MPVAETHCDPETAQQALPGTTFADRFVTTVAEPGLDAGTAARRAFGTPIPWVSALMAVRGALVAPFGLRHSHKSTERRVGFFPIVSEAPDRLVLGFDDRHLDFRIVVDATSAGAEETEIGVATLVKTNNRLGRLYLALVMPFHRRIVPAMLARVHRR
ncbi:MAG: DUF2867 domain-containing protein [Rhodobiaceae bacterium]|nr:DUF2867 domain-containing protein [Rhodobiaceae bacterium]